MLQGPEAHGIDGLVNGVASAVVAWALVLRESTGATDRVEIEIDRVGVLENTIVGVGAVGQQIGKIARRHREVGSCAARPRFPNLPRSACAGRVIPLAAGSPLLFATPGFANGQPLHVHEHSNLNSPLRRAKT